MGTGATLYRISDIQDDAGFPKLSDTIWHQRIPNPILSVGFKFSGLEKFAIVSGLISPMLPDLAGEHPGLYPIASYGMQMIYYRKVDPLSRLPDPKHLVNQFEQIKKSLPNKDRNMRLLCLVHKASQL